MQYINLIYDIGKTSKSVLRPKKFWAPVKKPSNLPTSLLNLKSKARPKNNHQDIVTSFHLPKNQVDWKKCLSPNFWAKDQNLFCLDHIDQHFLEPIGHNRLYL